MLQPLQLQDVSVRYENEIAELRDFLSKAGHPPLGTADTLSGISARLRDDRAYRRDLTSYIWVVLHQCDHAVRYSDLLGMTALAAAGPHFAAAADETDAHDLLRFLMDARRSFDAVSGTTRPAAPPGNFQLLPVALPMRAPFHASEVQEEEERRKARPAARDMARCRRLPGPCLARYSMGAASTRRRPRHSGRIDGLGSCLLFELCSGERSRIIRRSSCELSLIREHPLTLICKAQPGHPAACSLYCCHTPGTLLTNIHDFHKCTGQQICSRQVRPWQPLRSEQQGRFQHQARPHRSCADFSRRGPGDQALLDLPTCHSA